MDLTLPEHTPLHLREALLQRLEQAGARLTAPPSCSASPARPEATLSRAQRRLWFLDQLTPGTAAYNIPIAWRLRGRLDATVLERALREIARRHVALRTCVVDDDGSPRPVVRPESEFHMAERRVADPAELERFVDDFAGQPFALQSDLPFRAALARRTGTDDDAVLVLVVHHIAADGWSLRILTRELEALHDAFRAGLPSPLAEPTGLTCDAAAGEAEGPDADRVAYWSQRLDGAPTMLNLPLDRHRPAHPSGSGAILAFEMEAETTARTREFARATGTTPYAVLLAAFSAAAARWSGQDDVIIGVPFGSREDPKAQGLVGCYVNTVPVRIHVEEDLSGLELVRRVQAALLDDTDHAVPFDQLVEAICPERTSGQSPLVQALFVATDGGARLQLGGLGVEDLAVDPGSAKLDLSLSVDLGSFGEGPMAAQLTYDADLFEPQTAQRLAEQFCALVADLVSEPGHVVASLSLGGPAHEGAPPRSPAREGSILELFHENVRTRPNSVAVADDTGQLTYAELAQASAGVARQLQAAGVSPGHCVGLLAPRSVASVTALLAILRAGAAYLPVDPVTPAARLNALLESAGATVLLSESEPAGAISPQVRLLPIGEPSVGDGTPWVAPVTDPRSLAYVIATSGSTGLPKLVGVEHRQLRSYVDAVIERLDLASCGSFALVSALAADLGHTALFPALCLGASVRLVSGDDAADPDAFSALLRRHPVDVLKIVPTHLTALMSGEDPADVLPRRLLVLGGEASGWELVDRVVCLAPHVRVVNHYGPTEATVGALTAEVGRICAGRRPATVPLGTPLPHAVVRVLDAGMRPVPDGVAGELYIGGAGVARGYLGDPDLTAQRFVSDPFGDSPDARLYRTGDLARRLPDGSLAFLGRTDDQVKIRGYRVEPAEVTAVLRQHPQVRDAVVVAETSGTLGPRLVGYLAADPEVGLVPALSRLLADRLPPAMTPSALVVLDALPLTPNGKLDRRALPPPPPIASTSGRHPTGPSEETLARLWCELLDLSEVTADDDFFALGGHSLLATRLLARVRRAFGAELSLSRLFDFPTLSAQATCIEAARWASTGSATQPPRDPAAYDEGEL